MKNNSISNICKVFALLVVVAFGFTACSEDNDDNPTIDLSHASEGFVLNTPAYAANGTYDLANATSVNLTATQPNYGEYNGELIPYAVRYYVQVSLENDFTDSDKYVELATSYTTAAMSVDATEVSNAVVTLWQNANPDEEYVVEERALYIRLRAVLDNSDNMGETYSNVICLPSVLATYQAPAAELPTEFYVCGASIQDAWSSWKPLGQVYGIDGEFYTIIYADADSGFKFGTYPQQWLGYSNLADFNDEAGAGISEDGDGNIVIANAGWYTLHFVVSIVGTSNLAYTLNIYNAEACVTGNAFDGGSWSGVAMTAPADKSGVWESVASDGSGELRAYITVGSYDWWRTEFTLHDGELYFRDVDIPNDWNESMGGDYSVTLSAGQKLYVDFDANTGYVE